MRISYNDGTIVAPVHAELGHCLMQLHCKADFPVSDKI